jgi:hypothetical protein
MLYLDANFTHFPTQFIVDQFIGCVLDYIPTAGDISGFSDSLKGCLEIAMNLAADLGTLGASMLMSYLRTFFGGHLIAEASTRVSVIDSSELGTGTGTRSELRVIGIVFLDCVSDVILARKAFLNFAC